MSQYLDPVSRRAYLGHCMSEAQNACELLACTIAIRLLEDKFPFLKKTTYDVPEREDDLTGFLF
jgi:hypothetical protein